MRTSSHCLRCAGIFTWLLLLLVLAPAGFPARAADDLIDHNGQVLVFPDLYITYWGSAWANAFVQQGIPSQQYRTYMENFLNSICSSPLLATQSQYRFASCTNNAVLGTWIDANDPPKATPTSADIREEVKKSIQHFQGTYPGNKYAVSIIMLAPGFGDTTFAAKGGPYCAYHNMADYRAYIVFPFQFDSMGCRAYAVNPSVPVDPYGHGVFDGDSISMSHELAETLTDPDLSGGFYAKQGLSAETGDKCNSIYADMTSGGTYYAVQALWSNQTSSCVFGTPAVLNPVPASHDFSYVLEYDYSSPLTVTLTNGGQLSAKVLNPPTLSNPWNFQLAFNTCTKGKLLPPGGSCKVDVIFKPEGVGSVSGNVAFSVIDPLGSVSNPTAALQGIGAPHWMFADPGTDFGPAVRHGPPPPELPIRVHNLSNDPKLIRSTSFGGANAADFLIVADDCSGHALAPAGTCTVSALFSPSATGERRADLQVAVTDAAGGAGSTFGIPVRGTGLGPVLQLAAPDLGPGSELSFDDLTYAASGPVTGAEIPVAGELQKDVTLSNTGQTPLVVSGAEVSGDFALVSNGCATPVLPGASCVLRVRIRPTHFQAQSGTLTIYDDADDSPQSVSLGASVIAPVAIFSADEVQLGPVAVGIRSIPRSIRLQNPEGYQTLHIQEIAATGGFTATSNCPADLLIGNCDISIGLTPPAAGPASGMLVVSDSAPGSPHLIPLGAKACGADRDCDGDEIPDASDNCPFFPNPSQEDGNGNHRGDACECGDQSPDGRVDVNDLLGINLAIFNPERVTPLCDTNGDGLCSVSDILGANRAIFVPKTSVCARQPVPGP